MNLEDLRRWHVKQSEEARNSLCCGSGSFECQEARHLESFHDNAAALILNAMKVSKKMAMDWNEKARAINVLGTLSLVPESDGWLAESALSTSNGVTIGRPFHRALLIEEAVLGLWQKLTHLPADSYVVTDAGDPEKRRHWRWAGFMWRELPR